MATATDNVPMLPNAGPMLYQYWTIARNSWAVMCDLQQQMVYQCWDNAGQCWGNDGPTSVMYAHALDPHWCYKWWSSDGPTFSFVMMYWPQQPDTDWHIPYTINPTTDAHPVLFQCWYTVYDGGPTLEQH